MKDENQDEFTDLTFGWHSIEEGNPDVKSGLYLVRMKNGNEKKSIFYHIGISWLSFYGLDRCLWWEDTCENQPLLDVTHWKKLKKDNFGIGKGRGKTEGRKRREREMSYVW